MSDNHAQTAGFAQSSLSPLAERRRIGAARAFHTDH